MCARYHSVLDAARLKQFFKSRIACDIAGPKPDVFPGYRAPFIRKPPEREGGDDAVPDCEALVGLFGLLPHWAKDEKLTKSTTTPAARRWQSSPRSGTPGGAPSTRIARADGKPMGIAGLWSRWRSTGGGQDVHSFTMMTINADTHPLMCRYHRPGEEKRTIVILREEDFDAWLDAPVDRSMEFMRQWPPDALTADSPLAAR